MKTLGSLPVSAIEILTKHLKRSYAMLYEECAAISAASITIAAIFLLIVTMNCQ